MSDTVFKYSATSQTTSAVLQTPSPTDPPVTIPFPEPLVKAIVHDANLPNHCVEPVHIPLSAAPCHSLVMSSSSHVLTVAQT